MSETPEYRDVPGFPGYLVGSDGSVWSAWKIRGLKGERGPGSEAYISDEWKEMKPSAEKTGGYLIVGLRRDGKGYSRKVHHIVLEAFVGPRPEGKIGAHNNGVRTDNRATNLRWATHKENSDDRERHGNTLRGEMSPNAKLTNDEVKALRWLRREWGVDSRTLSRMFGIAWPTVKCILAGVSWKGVV